MQPRLSNRTSLWLTLLLPLTILPLPAHAADSYDPNLLANGSFENGFTAWQTYLRWGFQNVTFHTADTNTHHHGAISVRVDATEFPENAGWRQTVAVFPNTLYRLSGWIKTHNLRTGTANGAANLAVLDPAGVYRGVSDPVTGITDWTYTELTFDSGSFTSLEIRAGIGTLGRVLGTAWFDDLQLREVVPRPFIIDPADTTAIHGQPARLTCDFVSPIPVQFQWFRDHQPIPTATNQTLDLGTAQPALSAHYSVQVSNAGGTATSRAALLEIVPGTLDAAPALAGLEMAPLNFHRAPLPITSTLAIDDPDNSHLVAATVAFTGGYNPLEDILAFADRSPIGGHFDATTGTLELSGKATVAQYQSALRAVRYHNPRSRRTPGPRTISITVSDGRVTATAVNRTILISATPAASHVVPWGDNRHGQLSVPAGLTNLVATAAGATHTIGLRADGTVVSWGGNPLTAAVRVPDGLRDVVAIAAQASNNLALKSDGTVVSRGTVPAPTNLSSVIAVAAGVNHGLALLADGSLRAWGANNFTQSVYDPECNCHFTYEIELGQATAPPGTGFTTLAAGTTHSLALRADGSVVSFGAIFDSFQSYDQNFIFLPGAPDQLPPVEQIAAAGNTSKFLLADGNVAFHAFDPGPPVGLADIAFLSPFAAITKSAAATSWGPPGQAPRLANVFHIASAAHVVALVAGPAPVLYARPQSVTGPEDSDLVITLDSTEPPASGILSAQLATLPLNGTLYQFDNGRRGTAITSAGTALHDTLRRVIYAPTPHGNGLPFDSFQFMVSETYRRSDPARVTINITPVNDPPIAGFGTSLRLPGFGSAEIARPPFASPTTDFTIELWLRTTVLNDGSFHGILGRQNAGGISNRSPSLWQGPDRGSLHLDSYSSDGRRFGLLLPGFFQEVGAWVHLAVVKQGTTYTIYRNGRHFAVGQAPAAVRILPDGYSFGRVDNHFRGELDEIRIWQTARPASAIRAETHRAVTGHEPGLLGAWSCNEATGRMLRDVSPARRHARLQGSANFSSAVPPAFWESPRATALTAWLPASDFEADLLRFETVAAPRSGTLRLESNGRFTYLPHPDFVGTDTFTYRVHDGRRPSLPATVTIRVTNPHRR